MATPSEKLASSLEKLKNLQDSGIIAIKTNDLTRVHRDRLVHNGFIKEVIKGWYIATPHDEQQGDSTSWFTSFWEFCSRYLEDRYRKDYCVSAEQSLSLNCLVAIGLLKPSDLAGYRNAQVYIGKSKHIPVNRHGVRDVMPLLFELLENEKEASVRAVLGHFIFVFIHPYMDGNGRIGRFLMNTMLVSGGYPWTVIPVEERDRYMNALEKASVEKNIKPFAEFIAYLGLPQKVVNPYYY